MSTLFKQAKLKVLWHKRFSGNRHERKIKKLTEQLKLAFDNSNYGDVDIRIDNFTAIRTKVYALEKLTKAMVLFIQYLPQESMNKTLSSIVKQANSGVNYFQSQCNRIKDGVVDIRQELNDRINYLENEIQTLKGQIKSSPKPRVRSKRKQSTAKAKDKK